MKTAAEKKSPMAKRSDERAVKVGGIDFINESPEDRRKREAITIDTSGDEEIEEMLAHAAKPYAGNSAFPKLTTEESELRAELEAEAKSNYTNIGRILTILHDKNLYRSTHPTFATYVLEVFALHKSQAYRLIEAYAVVTELSPHGESPIPATESGVRLLKKVKPGDRKKAMKQAEKLAGKGKIKTSHMKKAVAKFVPKGKVSPANVVRMADVDQIALPISIDQLLDWNRKIRNKVKALKVSSAQKEDILQLLDATEMGLSFMAKKVA